MGGYWCQCVMEGVRILHLALADGETAGAEYRPGGWADNPLFQLEQLRGACNTEPSSAARRLAHHAQQVLSAPALREHRTAAAAAVAATCAQALPGPVGAAAVRLLDRRSLQELRMVIAWSRRRADWCMAVRVLLCTHAAGFAHAAGPQAFPRLASGDALQLVREPANPYNVGDSPEPPSPHQFLGEVARPLAPSPRGRRSIRCALRASDPLTIAWSAHGVEAWCRGYPCTGTAAPPAVQGENGMHARIGPDRQAGRHQAPS